MSKLHEMLSFLHYSNDYTGMIDGDIWQKIASMDEISQPIMDIDLSQHPDCKGERLLYPIFFSGDSAYFAAIWLGNDDIEMLDSMPVYTIFMDMDGYDDVVEPCGNFRTYIESVLHEFLTHHTEQDEYYYTAHSMLERVKVFSDKMIDKGNYTI